MSGICFLKFRSAYVRLTFSIGKTVAQICGRDEATPFTSEADAWLAAHQHHLRSDWCEVVSANDVHRRDAETQSSELGKVFSAPLRLCGLLVCLLLCGCKSFDMEPAQQRKYRELRQEYQRTNGVPQISPGTNDFPKEAK